MELPNAVGEWRWYYLSMGVPISDIMAHPDLPWNRHGLSLNKGMTVDLTDEALINATGQWNWHQLSRMTPVSDIMAHPDLPWNRDAMSQNRGMTVDLMHELDEVLVNATGQWSMESLSQAVSISNIMAHPDLPWNRYGLSLNKEMTVDLMHELDDVLVNAVWDWDWTLLTQVIDIDEIKQEPEREWSLLNIMYYHQLTLDLVNELTRLLTRGIGDWDWYWLSRFIPMEEIRQRPDLPWVPEGLAYNPGVTVDDVLSMGVTGDIEIVVSMEEIKANPLWPWNKDTMSMNPSISIEMVLANLD